MSPAPIAGAVGSGILKVGTAKQMAKALKAMKETDWVAVDSAMQSIKDFGASASLVQETLTDIKTQAEALVDIALGDALAQLALEFNKVFEQLEPLATAINNITTNLDSWGIKIFDTSGLILDSTEELAAAEAQAEAFRAFMERFWENFWAMLFNLGGGGIGATGPEGSGGRGSTGTAISRRMRRYVGGF